MISLADVRAAAEHLTGVAHRTPVLTSRTLDGMTGAAVFLKAENLQRGGAFKFRGAYNKITSLTDETIARGVAAFSSGNHAQAVALAAAERGVTAVILMPEDTPKVKIEATRGYGAEIVTYDRYTQDRTELGRALAAERGLALIPPYDDPHVIAGQGTVALELLEEVSGIDTLVVPVGGGGLISGCATVASARERPITVIGVEPEAGDDTRRSLLAGARVRIAVPQTIADGQQAETPGELTFEIVKELVEEIVTVTDAEIVGAMRFLFERMKVVAEPSGATAVAALLAGRVRGRRIGAILSGGNIGAERFATLTGAVPADA